MWIATIIEAYPKKTRGGIWKKWLLLKCRGCLHIFLRGWTLAHLRRKVSHFCSHKCQGVIARGTVEEVLAREEKGREKKRRYMEERRRDPVLREGELLSMKKYQEEFPDRVRESNRKAKAKNPEKYREHVRQWRLKNKERMRELGERFRKNNPEAYKKSVRKYLSSEKGKLRSKVTNARRRACNVGAGPITPGIVKIRFGVFGNECAYCSSREKLSLDHLLALSKGGTNHEKNLLPACSSCNSSKRDLPWKSWFRGRDFYSVDREIFIEERSV